MQLYAIDLLGSLVFANKATKQQNYCCLECGGIVRLRGGIHRQKHFYHLDLSPDCRQNGKSMVHLQIQCLLQQILPTGDCVLEKKFSSINRIADAVWLSENIIFEIQCSDITQIEVEERNRDYASQGYQVVWLLHDQRYNRYRLKAAEIFLESSPFYFTNIDEEGVGMIYDQFDLKLKGLRLKQLSPQPIEIIQIHRVSKDLCLRDPEIPRTIKHRLKNWPICFKGDLISQALEIVPRSASLFSEAKSLEESFENLKPQNMNENLLKAFLKKWIARPYALFFQMLLERACK